MGVGIMDRVAWVVIALYIALFAMFTVPYVLLMFPDLGSNDRAGLYAVYREPVYWAFLVLILFSSQFVLLRIPVKLRNNRPVGKQPVWITVVVGALFMAGMFFTLLLALTELILQGKNCKTWVCETWGPTVVVIFFLTWAIWAVIFKKYSSHSSPEKLSSTVSLWLLRGSILELLIAVPSHIYIRQKTYCCAGMMTFLGITMGVTVMLLAFGPSVYYLYKARLEKKRSST